MIKLQVDPNFIFSVFYGTAKLVKIMNKLCMNVQLRPGSILVDFTISAPANVSSDTAANVLQVSTPNCSFDSESVLLQSK